jgi:hypothetical protein
MKEDNEMSDFIEAVTLKAYVQENGIIREDKTGRILGRLGGISYEEVKELSKPTDEKIDNI